MDPLFPTATVVSLLAFAFALSEQATVALVATLLAWVASLLTFVAFIIDLILFGWTKHEFGTLNVDASTATASGESASVLFPFHLHFEKNLIWNCTKLIGVFHTYVRSCD